MRRLRSRGDMPPAEENYRTMIAQGGWVGNLQIGAAYVVQLTYNNQNESGQSKEIGLVFDCLPEAGTMFDCLETLGISGPVKESEEHSHNGIIEGVVRGGARGRCHKK